MYQVTIPLYGVDKTFNNPILATVGKDILDFLELGDEVSVSFENLDKSYRTGTVDRMADTDLVKPLDSKLYLEFNSRYDIENINEMVVSKTYKDPVFLHKTIMVEVKPITVPITVDLKLTFRSRSKSAVQRWYDNLHLRVTQSANTVLHKITYRYYVPSIVTEFLHHIYTKVKGYEPIVDFHQYLSTYSDGRLRWLTDSAGKHLELAVEETRSRILGRFEIGPMSIETDTDNGLYETSVSYQLSMDRPTHLHVRYPVMVYNQVLDRKYLLPKSLQTDDRYEARRDYMDHILRDYERQLEYHNKNLFYFIRVPFWDRFQLPKEVPFMAPIFSVLVQLTPDDRRSLVNLTDLGEIDIRSEILDFFRSGEYAYLNKPFSGFFYLALLENDTLKSHEVYEVNSNLDVYATMDLDLSRIYRLVLYLVLDPTVVSDRGWYAVRDDDTMRSIIEDALGIQRTRFPYNTTNDGYLDPSSRDRIHGRSGGYATYDHGLSNTNYDIWERKYLVDWNTRKAIMKTVQFFHCISYRRGEMNADS